MSRYTDPLPGSRLPFTQVFTTDSGLNDIPAMTDPQSSGWSQPADIRHAPMDDTHVILRPDQVAALCEYDRSYPSGTYNGKCWLRNGEQDDEEVQWLVWYHEHPEPNKIAMSWRLVLIC